MDKKKYLIFDIGASNGRSMVAESTGTIFKTEVTHRFDNSPVLVNGTLYWDILSIFSEVKKGLRISLSKHPEIVSMSIDTWGCDFGLIDKNGTLIENPIAYRNKRRHDMADKLYCILPKERLFDLCGGDLITIMGLYELFGMKETGSVAFSIADKLLMIPDLLNYFLTGKIFNEITDATMTLMCDQNRRQWDPKIYGSFGIPDSLFAEISSPGDIVGVLREDLCAELGVNPIKVVACASHDTASAVAGLPVLSNEAEWLFISLGTWGIIGIETPHPIINQQVYKNGFGNTAGIENKNILMKLFTGLWIIQQCREKWIKDGKLGTAWAQIVEMSQESSGGYYIDVDDPMFGGVQPDMPQTILDYCGKTAQPVPKDMGDFARCVYDSLVLKAKSNFNILTNICQKRFHTLHVVGGGSKNKALCQMLADALNVRVISGPAETTSTGNLLMQLKADNVIGNIEEGRRIALQSFENEITVHKAEGTKSWEEKFAHFQRIIRKEPGDSVSKE